MQENPALTYSLSFTVDNATPWLSNGSPVYGDVLVIAGDNVTFSIYPEMGYEVSDVWLNCGTFAEQLQPDGGVYCIYNVQGDWNVEITTVPLDCSHGSRSCYYAGNGWHVLTCWDCGYQEWQICLANEENGLCRDCGNCMHTQGCSYLSYNPGFHSAVCSSCGEQLAEDFCEDFDCDGICDLCGTNLENT